MKKLVIGTTLLMSMGAFAQINYDEINAQNAETINSEYSQSKIERKNARTKKRQEKHEQRQLALKNFFTIDKTNFPKVVKISPIENSQKNLLSCVRKIVQKHKGGYDAPSIAQGILLSAMDHEKISNDQAILESTTSGCLETYNNLYNFKKKSIKKDVFLGKIEALKRSTPAEIKSYSLIKNIYDHQERACKLTSVEASAALFIGFGAGVHNAKCVISDGRVRNYVGFNLKWALVSVGAHAGVTVLGKDRVDVLQMKNTPVVGRIFRFEESEDVSDVTLGLGKSITGSYYEKFGESFVAGSGLKIGAYVGLMGITVGPHFRVFNGKTRWNLLIDQLK